MSVIRKFWKMELQFKSALHVGCGASDHYMGADRLIRNGAGEFVLPGSSLAGAFISTLRNCVTPEPGHRALWEQNTGQNSGASNIVFRSHPLEPAWAQIRDGVRINRKMKTALDGAKFSKWEIFPKNTVIMIDLDNMTRSVTLSADEVSCLEKWIEAVLYTWKRFGLFLGGGTGTGCGYCVAKRIERCELDSNNYQTYLDSALTELPDKELGWKSVEPGIDELHYDPPYLRSFSIRLETGLKTPLLIKGNESTLSQSNPSTDAAFINRNSIPFIPGSSIRGAISTLMDKYGWADWKTLLGQTDAGQKPSAQAGFVIFTDLTLEGDDSAHILKQIERHAEDQFSREVYGTGKFNEERLFNACFQGSILILRGATLPPNEIDRLFKFLVSTAAQGAISIGSGACFPAIKVEENNGN